MKFNKKSILMGLVALTLFGTSCGSQPSSNNSGNNSNTDTKIETTANEAESTMIYGSKDYTSINPALYEHGEINTLIFSGLTAHDKNNNIVPELSENWSLDKETNTYRFNLRNNVKWQDGQEFTAEDVKFTLESIMNPDNGSEIASNYEDIESIDVIDKLTIDIKLKSPNVAMLDYLTIGILPKHILENQDLATSEFNQNPVGTGPFKLSNWDRGQSIILVKNEDFYGNVPKIDKIIFKIVSDDKARAIQLKSGELDMAQITPKDAITFETEKEFVVNDMKTADYRGILYNFNNELFKNNRELPNALSYAIDRQAILDSVLLGSGEIAYSPLQMGEYNNPSIEKFSYDPQKAKSELEKSGWLIGDDGIYEKNGQKLAFEINCMEGDQVRLDMAIIAAQNLQSIGVSAKAVAASDIDWDNQAAFLIGWGSPFDPDDHTYKVFGTDKGSNYQYYSNEAIDSLLQSARETDIKADRMKYYSEFQQEMTKDMPYTFIAYIDAIYVSKNNIKGVTPETLLGHHGVGIFWNIEDWEVK